MVFTVIDLGLGDAGKGTIVDYLTRQYAADMIARFNGGPQAAHHVVTLEGVIHCFAQFGSGTFVPETITYLSEHMLVNPLNIECEAEHLVAKGIPNAVSRLVINGECPVITPFQVKLNRMRELARGSARHGSCGMGVGETVQDLQRTSRPLRMRDLQDCQATQWKLRLLQADKVDAAERLVDGKPDNEGLQNLLAELRYPPYVDMLAEAYQAFAKKVRLVEGIEFLQGSLADTVVFEGAQGVLLDPEFGLCWPYVTKTKTTLQNAQHLLESCDYNGPVHNIGVLRAYATRHGQGSFVTEDDHLTRLLPERHNGKNLWQGAFRVGWFDLVATRYALEVTQDIDSIALTNLGRLCTLPCVKVCTHYLYLGSPTEDFDEFFEWEQQNGYVQITRLKVPNSPTRERQQRLGELLNKCTPGYVELDSWTRPTVDGTASYIDFMERELETPVSIVSFGPTAEDKVNIRPLTR